MPGGDGNGPRWAQGGWNCRRGFGRGLGFGRMYGSGFGRGYLAFGQFQNKETSSEEEANELRSYSKELAAELEDVKKRIAQLEKVK